MPTGLDPDVEAAVVDHHYGIIVNREGPGRHVTGSEHIPIEGGFAARQQVQQRRVTVTLTGRGRVGTNFMKELLRAKIELAQTSSMSAISAPSPRRGPSLTMRVYPPGRSS